MSLTHLFSHSTCSVCVTSQDGDDLRSLLAQAIMSVIVFTDNDKCEAAQIVTLYWNKSSNSCLCVVSKHILDSYIHLKIRTCVRGYVLVVES